MPLRSNGIIERWVILDYSILVIYPPSATSAKNKRVFFTKCLRKKVFFSHSGQNKLGYAAVIILSVFVKAANGICNQYFAQQKLTRPFR